MPGPELPSSLLTFLNSISALKNKAYAVGESYDLEEIRLSFETEPVMTKGTNLHGDDQRSGRNL